MHTLSFRWRKNYTQVNFTWWAGQMLRNTWTSNMAGNLESNKVLFSIYERKLYFQPLVCPDSMEWCIATSDRLIRAEMRTSGFNTASVTECTVAKRANKDRRKRARELFWFWSHRDGIRSAGRKGSDTHCLLCSPWGCHSPSSMRIAIL